jgi:membrane-associated protease RseP (regulator of RpoE activity)
MVRVKINGKGPFNFILDTGAPLIYVTKEVEKKLGLHPEKGAWTTLDRLDIEGGVNLEKVKVRLETPFQLEGMNALGFAGVELHGILGYTLLARYRVEFDFTRDTLAWTRLDFQPPQPQPLGKGTADPGLGVVAGMMKMLAFLIGKAPEPVRLPRGFLGVELDDSGGAVAVKAILAGGPAAQAGLKVGDRISEVRGKTVLSVADVLRRTAALTAGQPVRITVRRGEETRQITVTSGEGL